MSNGTNRTPFENTFSKADIHADEVKSHLERINREFDEGFEFLRKYPKSVSIFGSSTIAPAHGDYAKAGELASRVVKELKYAVITGGGPGIMEAANKGAYEAGGISLGLNVSIPHERVTNPYVTHAIKFSYFFSRKVMLMFAAEAYVFFPGGYGTLDELFNILTLVQTEKIPRVPVILYGSDFWKSWQTFLHDQVYKARRNIEESDLSLFEITDSLDRVMEIIKKAPVFEWWRNIN